MGLRYKQKLFLYFAVIFTVFTLGVLLFERSREKTFKTEGLTEKLDAYTEIVNAALSDKKEESIPLLNELTGLLPNNLRLSVINLKGKVLFDNTIDDFVHLENHSHRPEIMKALELGQGSDIRLSVSNKREYLYYAKKFGDKYIRVALPYDIQTKRILQVDNIFLYYVLVLLVFFLLLLNVVTNRFAKSIQQLRDFILYSDKESHKFNFPNDELGEIGSEIIKNYQQLNEGKKKIDLEREKLLQHIHTSEEGICFFSSSNTVKFYNSLFIQFLNTLTDEPDSNPSVIFSDPLFSEVSNFISQKTTSYFETRVNKHGKVFSLRVNIFDDKSFEIILNDITKQERTKILKQEMTGNIAHELRTPVTSIRAYLETVLEQNLSEEKQKYFIKQAYSQTVVLSELIRDMSLITKIEEAPQSFNIEEVNLIDLLSSLREDLSSELHSRKMSMQWNIPDNLRIHGNKNLLYSIFRNLVDNAIRYAGEESSIQINIYNQDKDYFYFSFFDTGVGISDETHLNRLFERFYRINEGRTRDTGGSGLGLSIVKNAIAYHKGTILARNRKAGGLEFLFKLSKNPRAGI